ncbi:MULTISPECIES: hypothetical protein [unclassified Streptomyces]|uniref:hypothetical protein n=1 Tax=unclassified Streptomyces TaxID=2593676 RepID=UPI00342E572E
MPGQAGIRTLHVGEGGEQGGVAGPAGEDDVNITKQFADHTALHDLSLTVHDGEIFTLLGPAQP